MRRLLGSKVRGPAEPLSESRSEPGQHRASLPAPLIGATCPASAIYRRTHPRTSACEPEPCAKFSEGGQVRRVPSADRQPSAAGRGLPGWVRTRAPPTRGCARAAPLADNLAVCANVSTMLTSLCSLLPLLAIH